MNTIDITVPQTVGVPLEPIVEAVRQALSSDFIVGEHLDKVVTRIAETAINETDFSTTFHEVLDEQFDIEEYRDDVERMVETWFDYNFSFDNYSDDVQTIAESVLSDRGWDGIDPSEFPTIADHDALTARVAELESRVERLVSALQNAVRAYSVDGGAQ